MTEQNFSGSFTRDSTPGLLQYINMLRASGELLLVAAKDRAVVTFLEGRLVDTRFAGLFGEEALYQAMMMPNGSFHFRYGEVEAAITINRPLEALMLNAVYLQDIQGQPIRGDEVASLVSASVETEMALELRHFQLISMANGQRTLQQIAQSLHIHLTELVRFARDLQITGILRLETPQLVPVDPQFFQELIPRIFSLVGPVGEVMMLDVAEELGIQLEELEQNQVGEYLLLLLEELPSNRQIPFRAFAQDLMGRYGK
jgi:hypothetical protein